MIGHISTYSFGSPVRIALSFFFRIFIKNVVQQFDVCMLKKWSRNVFTKNVKKNLLESYNPSIRMNQEIHIFSQPTKLAQPMNISTV